MPGKHQEEAHRLAADIIQPRRADCQLGKSANRRTALTPLVLWTDHLASASENRFTKVKYGGFFFAGPSFHALGLETGVLIHQLVPAPALRSAPACHDRSGPPAPT